MHSIALTGCACPTLAAAPTLPCPFLPRPTGPCTRSDCACLAEQVLEAREEVDSTDDQERLADLLASNKQSQAQVIATLSEAFKADDIPVALAATTRMTYLVRLQQVCRVGGGREGLLAAGHHMLT